ncbi:MAG: hypothetical protein JWO68_4275 [Actinomycetia bacterium]|nr:hypothetical protein [Actinomycetes bacterium]
MRNYSDELDGLAAAYAAAKDGPIDSELARAFELIRERSVHVVASGGAFPAALLAAGLHLEHTGRFAVAESPLSFVEKRGKTSANALMLFSARGKHPDAAFAARTALSQGMPVILFTQRRRDELDAPFTSDQVTVVTLPQPHGPDGFLATQSLLVMATATVRMYDSAALPSLLHLWRPMQPPALRSHVLVLHGSAGEAAAADVEVRLHELGLAAVQTADYRNMAHGRHVGLSRNLGDTTIISLQSPESSELADKTIAAFPSGAEVMVVKTALAGAAAALELLASVAVLPVQRAADQNLQPSRPRVPAWGRSLYNLPFKRLYRSPPLTPIGRKVQAAGFSASDSAAHEYFAEALIEWSSLVGKTNIETLLLDYDGTCVGTRERYELPGDEVQGQIVRLLELGLRIAFATGRGDSLHRDLRRWVPRDHWGQIDLGLHNGSWRVSLADEVVDPIGEAVWVSEMLSRLEPLQRGGLVSTRTSGRQLTVVAGTSIAAVGSIRSMCIALAARKPELPVRVSSSGHSVDIVGRDDGKETFLKELAADRGNILAIGDQGALGGNDFEMLASSQLSVSVDRCSADPSRCWNISKADVSGPSALVEVLQKIRLNRRHIRLVLGKNSSM